MKICLFVAYFKDKDNILNHTSYIIISGCFTHSTIAVYLFQKLLLLFLSKKLVKLGYIYYFSDSSAAQYKIERILSNFCNH